MKILIVDDHVVVREGVRRLLGTLPASEIIEASNAAEALSAFRKEQPDVIVLDVHLGDSSGLELLQRLKADDKNAKVVMFTMHADPSYAARAIRSGAMGYVSKSAGAEELIAAVENVSRGDRYVDRDMASDLVFGAAQGADPFEELSNREVEILRLLGEGKSLTQIASTFGIAYKTVANSCTRLKEKLGLERTADLIRVSIQRREQR
jgi:two-component system invasion response regulator UvrY